MLTIVPIYQILRRFLGDGKRKLRPPPKKLAKPVQYHDELWRLQYGSRNRASKVCQERTNFEQAPSLMFFNFLLKYGIFVANFYVFVYRKFLSVSLP